MTGCNFGVKEKCNSTRFEAAQRSRQDLLNLIQRATASGQNGFFLTACSQHEEACRDKDFTSIKAQGHTMASFVANFLNGSSAKVANPAGTQAALGSSWPGDGSYPNSFGHAHGWC